MTMIKYKNTYIYSICVNIYIYVSFNIQASASKQVQ